MFEGKEALMAGLMAHVLSSGEKDKETADAFLTKAIGEVYLRAHQFKPGDLVEWKPSLQHANMPVYGKPAVVLAVDDRRLDKDGEPQGLLIGVVVIVSDTERQFSTRWLDKNRFQPYSPPPGPAAESLTEGVSSAQESENAA